MRERMRGNRAGNRREFSLRGWPGRLTGLLACVVVAVAGAGLAVGISSADSGPNAIQNGDFSSSASTGINSGSGITDWPVTVVTQNPTSGCTLTEGSANACNGPYIDVLTDMSCDPLPSGTPYLAEDVPDGSDAYVEQDNIVVPSSPGDLTFETWGNLDPANVTVSIISDSGDTTTTTPMATFTPPPMQSQSAGCTGEAPLQESISMAAYAGQTVGLRIEATSASNAFDGAYANFVDFSLQTASSTSGGSSGSTTSSTPGTPSTSSTSSTSSASSTSTTNQITPTGKLASATSVICNLDTQTGVDDCGASVADAAGGVSTPTGDVDFSDGGVGALLGSVCQLVPTPYSEGIASCDIQYRPADTSVQPTITASYQGDSTFAPSSGQQGLINGISKDDQVDKEDDACVSNCSVDSTYPNEVDPVTGDPVVVEAENKAAEPDEVTDGTIVNPADLEKDSATVSSQDKAAADSQNSDVTPVFDFKYVPPPDDTPQTTYDASTAGAVDKATDQGVNSDEHTVSSDDDGGGNLDSLDSSLDGAYSSDYEVEALGLRTPLASSASLGPAPALVLAALSSPHPSAADIAAFGQDIALATAPTYSPARAFARVTLLLGAGIGIHVIAHELGVKKLSQLAHAKPFTLGSVSRVLPPHSKTKVAIKPSAVGAQILRFLAVVGLGHKVTIALSVATHPTAGHPGGHVERPITVL